MVEIVWLATTVVSKFLVPLFKKGKNGFTDGLAEAVGRTEAESLVATSEKIWRKVNDEFDQDKEKSALTLFEGHPVDMEQMLIKLLQKRLEGDASFREQIQQLVAAPVADTDQTSWRLMGKYVGAVDARNAKIMGGTVAGVVVNADGSPDPVLSEDVDNL